MIEWCGLMEVPTAVRFALALEEVGAENREGFYGERRVDDA